MPRPHPFLTLVLTGTVLAPALSAQVLYDLVPLQGMNSPYGRTFAVDLSDDGLVLGGTAPQSSGPLRLIRSRPAVWSGSEMAILPVIVPSYGINNSPSDINAAGTIVGACGYAWGDPDLLFETVAVLWDAQGLSVLGALPGDGNSVAWAVNDAGVVVGASGPTFFSPGHEHAFRWENGVMTELPPLPGAVDANAFDVNAAGTAVGASGDFWGFTALDSRAVTWSGGVVNELPLPPGAMHALASTINDAGVVAGQAGTLTEPALYDAGLAPVRWAGGVAEWLPLLPGDNIGTVWDINQDGTIVGESGYLDGYIRRRVPVVWIGGVVHELGAVTAAPAGFAFAFSGPYGLNDHGQIVGSGDLNGRSVAFVATPRQ